MTLTFTVIGKIIPKSRPRFARGNVYTPVTTKDYEQLIAWTARKARARPYENPCHVRVVAVFSPPASMSAKKKKELLRTHCMNNKDADNVAKLLDALNGVAFIDDRQIVKLTIEKKWGEVELLEIDIEYLS